MVTITSLWLPILLSAILVWVASALAWMALPHHKSDFRKLPDEDAGMDALRAQNLSPGVYWFPWAQGSADAKRPEVQAKYEKGPVGLLTVWPNGAPNMGKAIALSLVYYLTMSVFVAYLGSRMLPPGVEYLGVFRLTGTVAFLAYSAALIPNAIWFGTPWSNTLKTMADGLVYGLLTAGVFGWLWPG